MSVLVLGHDLKLLVWFRPHWLSYTFRESWPSNLQFKNKTTPTCPNLKKKKKLPAHPKIHFYLPLVHPSAFFTTSSTQLLQRSEITSELIPKIVASAAAADAEWKKAMAFGACVKIIEKKKKTSNNKRHITLPTSKNLDLFLHVWTCSYIF